MAKALFGLVTRTFQTCVPKAVSTAAFTVMTIVLAFTTWMPVTCGALPCAPSKVTTAPLAKPVPLNVRFTVVFAGVVFGVMPKIFSCGVEGVMVTVGRPGVTVGNAGVGATGVMDGR